MRRLFLWGEHPARHHGGVMVLKKQLLICLVVYPGTAGAQQDFPEPSMSDYIAADVSDFVEDAASYFTAPFRFSATDWLLVGGTVGVTGGLMLADGELQDRLGRDTEKTLNDDFWDIPTYYGMVQYANLASLSTYAVGLFTGNDDIRLTGRLLFESVTLSGVSVIVLRYIFGRSRPYGTNSPSEFNWFEWANRRQSFPSGHTVVAFAVSTVLAERIDNLWARIAFYGIAGLTGFARVYNNQHWVSDVIAGAAFGLAAGFHVVAQEEKRAAGILPSEQGFQIIPTGNGLKVVYRLR